MRYKIKRNPPVPLSFYLKDSAFAHAKIYKKLAPEDKLLLRTAFNKNQFEVKQIPSKITYIDNKLPKSEQKEITVNYLVVYILLKYDKRTKYILGIIEIYDDMIEYHDFDNVIEKIYVERNQNKKQIVDSITNSLLNYYERKVDADVNSIFGKMSFEEKIKFREPLKNPSNPVKTLRDFYEEKIIDKYKTLEEINDSIFIRNALTWGIANQTIQFKKKTKIIKNSPLILYYFIVYHEGLRRDKEYKYFIGLYYSGHILLNFLNKQEKITKLEDFMQGYNFAKDYWKYELPYESEEDIFFNLRNHYLGELWKKIPENYWNKFDKMFKMKNFEEN